MTSVRARCSRTRVPGYPGYPGTGMQRHEYALAYSSTVANKSNMVCKGTSTRITCLKVARPLPITIPADTRVPRYPNE
eukprot:2005136-Rhodomonas_salina.3